MSDTAILNVGSKLEEKEDATNSSQGVDVDAIVAEEIARAKAEQEKAEKEKDNPPDEEIEKVSMVQLFKFADKLDVLLITIASVCSALNGASQPVMSIIFSNTIGVFTNYVIAKFFDAPDAEEVFDREIKLYILYFVILAGAAFLVAYFQMSFWMIAGERQCVRIREKYYRAMLRQEIGWFDKQKSGELTSRLSGDVNVIQDGVSEKVGLIIQAIFTLVAGFTIAFVRGWRLALVLLAVIPLIMLSGAFMGKTISSKSKYGQDAYARAGHLAEEVLSSIKTVVSFGGEKREIERYDKELQDAYNEGKRRALVTGFGIGVMIFIMFSSYALAFWYGGKLILDGVMNGAEVLNVIFALIIGAMGIGQAAPHFAAVSTAQGAASKIYHVIERDSEIDALSGEGRVLPNISGTIEFRNVDFRYPSRPDVQILKNFNLKVLPGQTVALVGSSGSGKSTCVQLLERFYDPEHGQVLLDGNDIKELNVQHLRRQIGLVGQEPVLFGVSIFQNIIWGAEDESVITMEQVVEASKKANAHEFIQNLPDGYDTLVGEKGALLSGGQKQRIAIARALINNPQIMLLDEATSALDTESEKLVQSALDNASKNRTTLVIAHRLSTIKDADMIVVMNRGEIVEMGKHDELVTRGGLYAKLVAAQTLKSAIRGEGEEDSSDDDFSFANPLDKSKSLAKTKTLESIKAKSTLKEEKEGKFQFGRIIKLNLPDKYLVLIGGIGSLVEGAILPIFSVVFAKILFVFSEVNEPDKMRSNINFWSLMFLVLAIVSFLTAFTRIGLFGIAGERLVRVLRSMSYRAMIRQEVGFFDMPENGTGILCSKLATEAESMKGLSSQVVGSILQGTSALVTGMTIAFVNGWKLTLVVLACVPLIGIAGVAQIKALSGYSQKTKKAYEEAAQVACESVENMRTVASLSREETFYKLYQDNLISPNRLAIRGALLSSIGYGCSQALIFLVYSVAFYYGSRLIITGEYDLDRMFRVLFTVVFSAVSISQVISFTPNVSKARAASISLFEIIDRQSRIDAFGEGGSNMETNGKVTANKVHFNYPARPDVPVLKGFQADVPAGKTVAIVGSSGSGKSTLVSLVQRFYDTKEGKVAVEDTDVRNWNLPGLRSQMAMVGQEPVLFDMSIGENIAYGVENASQEMIEQAAQSANIHEFIKNLPEGYNTGVGEKGAQLSGGQKQRVAIARAIIRNPRLLLLDEATSALDSESEKIVQNALDRAARNRTTITIAHRLSTIQDADVILVVKNGVVIEQGKHQELIRQKGFYYSLVQRQSLAS